MSQVIQKSFLLASNWIYEWLDLIIFMAAESLTGNTSSFLWTVNWVSGEVGTEVDSNTAHLNGYCTNVLFFFLFKNVIHCTQRKSGATQTSFVDLVVFYGLFYGIYVIYSTWFYSQSAVLSVIGFFLLLYLSTKYSSKTWVKNFHLYWSFDKEELSKNHTLHFSPQRKCFHSSPNFCKTLIHELAFLVVQQWEGCRSWLVEVIDMWKT